MKIVQISDCHLYADSNKAGYRQVNPYQSLSRVLKKVSELKPVLVIASGDISSDKTLQSYQHFSSLWQAANLACKLIVMPGNHDEVSAMQAHFAPHQLSLGGAICQTDVWQIHCLNSKIAEATNADSSQETRGQVSKSELLQLQSAISSAPNLRHLIAVHHHPIDCGGWMDVHEWINRQDFVDLVAATPQIKGVIYGHIHHASEQQQGECLFMSCPSTCWQWATQESFAASEESPGFRLIELKTNGQLSSQIIRIPT
jgi:Icc protein